jgi:hypothetical protein
MLCSVTVHPPVSVVNKPDWVETKERGIPTFLQPDWETQSLLIEDILKHLLRKCDHNRE